MRRHSFIFLLPIIFILAGCGSSSSEKEIYTEEELGYRKDNLYDEDAPLDELAEFTNVVAGSGEVLGRSFENAPPLISHSVTGMYPITIKLNACIQCHLPGNQDSSLVSPMPRSHFINYRPKHKLKQGIFIRVTEDNEVTSSDLGDKMYLGRYNCSQCHVPQTDVEVKIQNNFDVVFRNLDDSVKSNLEYLMNEGI